MLEKEATARIKINRLLEAGGWRFFADGALAANIRLEPGVSLKSHDLDALGNDFETAGKGYVDFLLVDARGFPLLVLEAKAESKNPLVGKEQARKYARAQNCRFVILSNGNLHYFWDLERGNPHVITAFPTPESVTGYQKVTPDPARLVEENIGDDFHPDQGPGHPQARLSRATVRRGHQGRRHPARENRLQAVRLLRQLRILRDRVQLRRSAEAAAPPNAKRRRRPRHRPGDLRRQLRAPGQRHPGRHQGADHRPRRHEDRPHVLRALRRQRARERRNRRGRGGRALGSRHRLRQPRGLRQARGVLQPRQAAPGRRRGPPPDPARDSGKIFGLIPRFKSKDELLEEEFAKFIADIKPEEAGAVPAIKTYFKAYVSNGEVRHIIDSKQFTDLATNPYLPTRDFKAVPARYRALVPEYVKDYVSLNQFAP